MTLLFNPARMVHEVVGEVAAPPPPIDYLVWAKRNIRFTDASSDFPGPYNDRRFPFFTEVLAALSPEQPCRYVTLAKSAQVGGTILANVFTLGTMDMAPCLFMYVHPTEENGDRWSKQKLSQMIRESVRMSELFPERSKDASNSVRYKERADGRGAIQVAGANSPANLSMMTVAAQVHDDLSKWEDNKAGDPEDQAESRSKAKAQAKIFKISTPMVSPGCRISRAYSEGTQERYHVPCPHCGEFQSLEWDNMRDHLDPAKPEDAHFVCVGCGDRIEERHREWMVDPDNGAHWVAKHPERMSWHRSFHIWMAYSPLESWAAIARGWAKVQSGAAENTDQQESRSMEQVFFNDSLGLPLVLDRAAVEWEALRDRAEENGTAKGLVPARALVLILGIDVQETWVEWTLWGFGRHGYRVPVDHGRFDGRTGRTGPGEVEHTGHISEPEIRTALDRLLARTWRDENGIARPVDMASVDANYTPDDVWTWSRKYPKSKVIMVRGGNQPYAPPIVEVKYETDRRGKKKRRKYGPGRFFTFNASEFKLRLMRDLRKASPDMPGHVELLSGMGDDFWQQLVSERRVMVRTSGRATWRWELPAGTRNEVLDNATQAMAGAYRLAIPRWTDDDWTRRELRIAELAPAVPDLEDLLIAPSPQKAVADMPSAPPVKDRIAALARARAARRE